MSAALCPCGAALCVGGPLTLCWACFAKAHDAELLGMRRAQIREELLAVEAIINKAYWAFTRTARGKPPCLVVPYAYAARKALHAELATLAGRVSP